VEKYPSAITGSFDFSHNFVQCYFYRTVNAGKSVLNEDCAVALTVILDSLPPTSCDSKFQNI